MSEQAFIVTDLSYGDTGKGSCVDYIARKSKSSIVVRFNGASQAAHNVITPDGTHHVFSQFGSASLTKNSKTFLSKYMLVNPLNMINEARHLIELGVKDIWNNTFIDPECIVITPWHEATNRLKEVLRDKNRHGSCGHGIGEAVKDNLEYPELTIRVKDIFTRKNRALLFRKLKAMREHKADELKELELIYNCDIKVLDTEVFNMDYFISNLIDGYWNWANLIQFGDEETLAMLSNECENIIFEGSQGVLLDEYWGFYPYTTWSNTTSGNALRILKDLNYDGKITRLGLIRAYTTRHGAGPFVTQDESLKEKIIESHNITGNWQGPFRIGWLDLVAHKYAIEANGGIDKLVVSGLDQIRDLNELKICNSYSLEQELKDSDLFRTRMKNTYEIKLGGKYDLNRREKLSLALDDVTPNYKTYLGTSLERETNLIDLVEKTLRYKVALKSYGPKANDKCENELF